MSDREANELQPCPWCSNAGEGGEIEWRGPSGCEECRYNCGCGASGPWERTVENANAEWGRVCRRPSAPASAACKTCAGIERLLLIGDVLLQPVGQRPYNVLLSFGDNIKDEDRDVEWSTEAPTLALAVQAASRKEQG